MNKIFKAKPKSPQELVRLTKESLLVLEKGESQKAIDKVRFLFTLPQTHSPQTHTPNHLLPTFHHLFYLALNQISLLSVLKFH
eukprot:Pgem_evm1s12590